MQNASYLELYPKTYAFWSWWLCNRPLFWKHCDKKKNYSVFPLATMVSPRFNHSTRVPLFFKGFFKLPAADLLYTMHSPSQVDLFLDAGLLKLFTYILILKPSKLVKIKQYNLNKWIILTMFLLFSFYRSYHNTDLLKTNADLSVLLILTTIPGWRADPGE